MPVSILVNFASLDPPRNGGVSRIGYHVARLLLDMADAHPVFVVNWAFASEFEGWLGEQAPTIPIFGSGAFAELQAREIMRHLAPRLIVSPLFGVTPFRAQDRVPHIASMPDTLVLDEPEYFGATEVRSRRVMYDQLRKAARIITISQFARRRLSANLGIEEARIAVAPLGADEFPLDAPEAAAMPPLPQKFWLYPANVWVHKRHDLLLHILALARERDPSIHLVLTGAPEPFVSVIEPLMGELGLPQDAVTHLGYVPDTVLAALYQKAEVMVFTSQYEGFGMPVLEAMRAGCPVVCAPYTALPEVAGDAALFVESDDPQAWANAVLDELPSRRAVLVERGYKRAAQFTWANTRQIWEDVIRAVLPELAAVDGRSAPPAQSNPNIRFASDEAKQLIARMETIRLKSHNTAQKAIALPSVWNIQRQLTFLARRESRI